MHVQLVISVSILLSWVQMGILKSRFVLDYTCDCCIDIKENWMLIHFLYDLGYILIIKNKLIFVCFDVLSFFFFWCRVSIQTLSIIGILNMLSKCLPEEWSFGKSKKKAKAIPNVCCLHLVPSNIQIVNGFSDPWDCWWSFF